MPDDAQREKAERFLAMHHAESILVLPNAWDGASAVILAEAGFPVVATTSAGIAFARGLPDGQRMTRTEMCEEVSRIVRLVGVPVTADMESGYGRRPEDVAETVRRVIESGAVGANIEDTDHRGDAPLFDRTLSIERIAAGREAADALGIPFVINARTDPYLSRGHFGDRTFAEAVDRANAYREAGARCVYVPGAFDRDTIAALTREIAGPLNILASAQTPSTGELQALGVARLSVGGGFARAAYTRTRQIAEELRDAGTYGYASEHYSNQELNKLLAGRLAD